MLRRIVVVSLLLALAGCASVLRTAPESATPVPARGHYEVEPGGDAARVAEMRAAAPPARPELSAGRNRAGDRNRLAARGFVHIGSGHFPGPEASARDDALRQGQDVGADRVLLYAPSPDAATTDPDWLATYYVRFQLPFGATFRDLSAQERATLASDGGVEIGSVIGGTPASRANLITGDFVLKLNGKPFANRAAFQALLKQHAGHPVTLSIVRNGETLERVVRLGVIPRSVER